VSFDPKVYRNNKDGIGGPGDAAATTTTEDSTLVSLLKGIFGKVGGGTSTVVASDVAQGSTTAGQTGGLVQGAVTTAAPTYTTGKTNPLSLEEDGDLRTHDAAATTLLTTIDSKLADLKTYTDGLETLATTLNGYVDGLETLIGTTNTSLTTLQGYVDSLESYTGTLTETAPASDTASSGLNGRLQRVAQRLTSLITQVTAGATAIAKAEDVASADADVGVPAMAVRKATPANTSGTDGDYEMLQISGGRLWASATIDAAIPAGTNLIGRAAADASAATGGIASTARLASAAASTNATLVKGSAGRIYQVSGKNNAAYDVFLVLYDSAASPPVPGTTTIRKKIVCPAGAAFVYEWVVGLTFATGIGYAFTKLVADADTTALVAADVTAFNLDYA
jgi:hypothetical protein